MRKEGWEQVLAEYIRKAETQAFRWGAHDCALWVFRFCDEVNDTQHVKDWMGHYKTEAGAAKLMRKRGFANVAAVADSLVGIKPVRLAQRGDAVQHPQGHLGLCNGRMSYFLCEGGAVTFLTRDCVRAWEI